MAQAFESCGQRFTSLLTDSKELSSLARGRWGAINLLDGWNPLAAAAHHNLISLKFALMLSSNSGEGGGTLPVFVFWQMPQILFSKLFWANFFFSMALKARKKFPLAHRLIASWLVNPFSVKLLVTKFFGSNFFSKWTQGVGLRRACFSFQLGLTR